MQDEKIVGRNIVTSGPLVQSCRGPTAAAGDLAQCSRCKTRSKLQGSKYKSGGDLHSMELEPFRTGENLEGFHKGFIRTLRRRSITMNVVTQG